MYTMYKRLKYTHTQREMFGFVRIIELQNGLG